MAELTDAATLAVLAEMGWPDDRTASAHVEPDGYQVTPPGTYWDMAQDVAGAVISAMKAIIRADERAKVAEEIAVAVELARGDRCPECKGWHASKRTPRGTTRIDYRCGCGHTWKITYASPWADPAAIARQHAAKPSETAVEAPAIARQHA